MVWISRSFNSLVPGCRSRTEETRIRGVVVMEISRTFFTVEVMFDTENLENLVICQ